MTNKYLEALELFRSGDAWIGKTHTYECGTSHKKCFCSAKQVDTDKLKDLIIKALTQASERENKVYPSASVALDMIESYIVDKNGHVPDNVVDYFESVRSVLNRPVASENQWMDISSAPRDGTPFLAMYLGKEESGRCPNKLPFICRYSPAFEHYNEGWELMNAYGDDEDNDFIKPTHWMPLPKNPEGE